MKEMRKHGKVGHAADRSGMDRKTARKYVRAGKLPSELKQPRSWRTRKSPISVEDWAFVQAQLRDSPTLEAKTLFEMLQEAKPGVYSEGQLRTLQRHVKQWRATKGPDKEVFFSQQHRPGEAAQTDFTHAKELGVTIVGVAFVHMLCHFVLPYSNWESVTVCLSESLLSLSRGVQAALFRLGHHPSYHQTDNSTAATHTVGDSKRKFNEEYASMIAHFGMKPRTTEVGAKEQNGDVEASNGALKRRVEQRLLVRGSRDFESVEAYEHWLTMDPVARANAGRRERLADELAVMPAVRADRLPEFREGDVLVTSWSTIRIDHNTYSVPSRLIAETVRVRIFERTIEVLYAQKTQLVIERVAGRNGHRINYRHLIWSLVQKPGAFARYRYREDLFPSLVFRRAYDAITGVEPSTVKDLAYLKILHLAAATSEADVEAALTMLLDARQVPDVDLVRELVGTPKVSVRVPEMTVPEVDLAAYDELLSAGGMKADSPHHGLAIMLRTLKLPTFAAMHEQIALRGDREGWTLGQSLRHLCELEIEERRQRKIARLLKASDFPYDKTLATLDAKRWSTKVQRQIPALCEGDFLDRAENLLVFGLPGRGKTHLCAAIGYELVRRGRPVYFTSTAMLVQRLLRAKRDLTLERELDRLDHFDAVVLDDIGYVQQERDEMEVLFTFLAARYERKSVIITSNLVFSQWDRIFKDTMTTAAAIDRLVHHSVILELTSKRSFRSDAARERNDNYDDNYEDALPKPSEPTQQVQLDGEV